MKQKRVILTLLAICFTARVFAELSLCDSLLIPIDSTVKVGVLPNGLTYYIKVHSLAIHVKTVSRKE